MYLTRKLKSNHANLINDKPIRLCVIGWTANFRFIFDFDNLIYRTYVRRVCMFNSRRSNTRTHSHSINDINRKSQIAYKHTTNENQKLSIESINGTKVSVQRIEILCRLFNRLEYSKTAKWLSGYVSCFASFFFCFLFYFDKGIYNARHSV